MLRDALVVGISSYQYLPGLSAPAHDAEAIAHQLETTGDFRVTRMPEIVQAEKLRVGVKTPVTLAALEAALVKLFKPKGSNVPHTALFYFSGHGLQKEAGICEGYLATSDANSAGHFYGLSLFWLRRLLQESPVRQRIVLLDCCHSGEMLNYLEADPGAKSGTDRLFMAASREYETAYESLTGQYSVFTQALLEGLDARRLPAGVVTNYALTDWVSNALKGEAQQPLFENSGSEIVLTRCQNPFTVLPSTSIPEVCPYRGLEPFDESHAEYFFGRESLTDQLIERLRTGNFAAVVGASGSGKSSLVKAGLIHRLRRGQALSGSDRWQIRILTPTEHPFKSLANAFVNTEASAVERAEQLRRAEMFLQEGATGLTQLVRASLISENRSTRLLLIIDQFEEIFTLCQGSNAERDRHRFFNSLLTTLHNLGEQFSLVIVLRADFFSKCSFYTELAAKIEPHLMMVTPLNYEQIKASIIKPAEKVGLVCDPNLVYNILLDIVGAPGELPLLQYTLLELWQRRQVAADGKPSRLTLDAYTELGGVRGTLQKRANEIFYSLTLAEQQVAKRIFIALTQLGEGTEDTRRRVLKSELVQSEASNQLAEQVLEKLVIAKLVVTSQIQPTSGHQDQVDQRFANVSTALRLAQVIKSKTTQSGQATIAETLPNIQATLNQKCNLNVTRMSQVVALNEVSIAGNGGCQETVDIAHEALIRNWGLLRSWLDENREMLRRQRRIERAAREWDLAQQQRSPEYLLRGSRLLDAEDFLTYYPDELSVLAQRYIVVSRDATRRTRRELRLLQVSVPCTLMVALGVTFNQYRMAIEHQAEKDFQLQVATSRQWSAIAQSLLQETDPDPTTALLISRLAAEQAPTQEAETSLRSALQALRLQDYRQISQKPLQQVVFSPQAEWFATVDMEGQLVISSLKDRQLKRVLRQPGLTREPAAVRPTTIAFSPDGKFLVADPTPGQIAVWAVETGELQRSLGQAANAITQVAIHPTSQQVAVSEGQTVKVWNFSTGELQSRGSYRHAVKQLQFNSDGSQLLVGDGRSIAQVQVKGHRILKTFAPRVEIATMSLTADDRHLAIATAQGAVQIWNVATGKLQQMLPGLAAATSRGATIEMARLLFSPNGEYIALVGKAGQIQVVQLQTGQRWELEQVAKANANKPHRLPAIAFSPDSRQIIIAGQPTLGTTRIASFRDVATGREVSALRGAAQALSTIQFSPDGSLLATTTTSGAVQLWNTELGSELLSLKLPATAIQWAGFQNPPATTDGNIFAIGRDGTLRQWQLITPKPRPSIAPKPAQPSPPWSIPDFRTEKVFQGLHEIRRWWEALGQNLTNQPVSSHAEKFAKAGSFQTSHAIASRETNAQTASSQLAAAPMTLSTLVTDLVRQMELTGRLSGVAISQDSKLIAIANHAGLVEVWQLLANRSMRRLYRLQSPAPDQRSQTVVMHHLAFSPDGHHLLGVSLDKSIHLWNLDAGSLRHQLKGHEALIEQAHFSADGSRIISASWDRTARIWDAASGQLITTLPQPDVVTSARFSADNQRIVVTSLDSTARVIDASTGAVQVILAGHRGAVLDGEFSPDGQWVVTASADGSARLWDATTGVERTTLRAGKADRSLPAVKKAFFSANGQYVATLDSDGTLNLWVATWAGLLDVARDRSLRQLTPDECLRYLRLAPNACPALPLDRALQP